MISDVFTTDLYGPYKRSDFDAQTTIMGTAVNAIFSDKELRQKITTCRVTNENVPKLIVHTGHYFLDAQP